MKRQGACEVLIQAHQKTDRKKSRPPITGAGEGSGGATNRIVRFDVARSIAALAVVAIHVSAAVFQERSVTVGDWWAANFFHAATVWAVPVFVMISGALLLDPARAYTIRGFLASRASRVLAPLCFWSIFFLWYRVGRGDFSWSEGLVVLLFGQPFVHLWYLYMIVGLYLVTPPLRKFVATATRAETSYALAVAFGLGICFSQTSFLLDLGSPLAVISFAPFVSYYLAGHALKSTAPSRRQVAALSLLSFLAVALTAVGTGYLHFSRPHFRGFKILCDQLSPTVVALSLSLFVLSSRLEKGGGKFFDFALKACRFIAPYSLGIYIVHPLFLLELCPGLGLDGRWMGAAVGVPATSLAVFVLSLIASYLISLPPYLRTIIGFPPRRR